MIRRTPPLAQAATPVAGAKPWGVAEIEERYRFPPGDGRGQVIGIVEFGFPMGPDKALMPAWLPDDLEAFCRAQGRPVPPVAILPTGHPPLDAATFRSLLPQLPEAVGRLLRYATGETMMDVEIVAGLCPRAKILVYVSTFDEKGWIDLLDLVLGGDPATPGVLSISYGLNEDHPNWSAAALREIELRLHAAALQGITVCVAAGDDGAGSHDTDGRAHVPYPAASPHVLAVGGTMLAGTQPPRPRWRGGRRRARARTTAPAAPPAAASARGSAGPPGSPGRYGRSTPTASTAASCLDVAALAGPPGYDIVMQGVRGSHGGTSAAAPVWAALLARLFADRGRSCRRCRAGRRPAGASRDITDGHNASAPSPGKGRPLRFDRSAAGASPTARRWRRSWAEPGRPGSLPARASQLACPGRVGRPAGLAGMSQIKAGPARRPYSPRTMTGIAGLTSGRRRQGREPGVTLPRPRRQCVFCAGRAAGSR
ncbi:MAG: S53 family peptidase [Dongiaceae bacterium]